MSPTRRRVLAIGTTVALVASLAAVGTADLWTPTPGGGVPDLPTVAVAPTSVTLACAPGTDDPSDAGATLAPGADWSSRGAVSGTGAPSLTVRASDPTGTLDVPTAVVVAGQGGGELRGLSLLPCTAPTSDQWVAAGSTEVGEDLLLVLSNPSTSASQVTITSYGASGRSQDAAQSVNVPAGQVVVLVPATWFPDEDRPSFHLVADGPGVSAWVQSSGLDGEVPTGLSSAAATQPGTDQVLPGVSAGSAATLRLVVPGDEGAHVSVAVSGSKGVEPLAGAEDLEVDAGVPLDVDLTGIPDDPSALVVTSDVPVVATAEVRTQGAAWPDSDQKWGGRTLVVPSTPTTSVDLPGAEVLSGLVEDQLTTDPLRATTVGTDSGGGDVAARLLVTAPADTAATVDVAGTTVDVPAGASVLTDLPADAGQLTSDVAVDVALVVRAGTPTGDLSAVWALGSAGIDTGDVAVDLQP